MARIHHVDALRCFCMLYGLLLHATTIGTTPLFVAISDVSAHFRMATFFLVSGFFTAMMCGRSDLGTFLTNRSRMLLVPFFATLLLVNPVTQWLFQWFHGGGNMLANPEWVGRPMWFMHLWFLLSLTVYAFCAPALVWLAGAAPAGRVVAGLERIGPGPGLLVVTLLVAGVAVVLRGFSDVVLGPRLPEWGEFIAQRTFYYFAFFAAGVFGYRHRMLFETFHRVAIVGLVLFGGAYLAHVAWEPLVPGAVERLLFWFVRTGFVFLIVCALLAVARRLVTRASPLLTRMTDGVYSFYLFHFLMVYLLANLLRLVTDNLYLIFAGIVLAGFPLLFLLHERVIAPSPLLRLLFNGKALPKRAQA
jgi:peptidoglycan/LPS O-acetylase OafA/YrhL